MVPVSFLSEFVLHIERFFFSLHGTTNNKLKLERIKKVEKSIVFVKARTNEQEILNVWEEGGDYERECPT